MGRAIRLRLYFARKNPIFLRSGSHTINPKKAMTDPNQSMGPYYSTPKILAIFDVEKVFVRDIIFNSPPTSFACHLFFSI